jgi:hypothetical protein
MSSAAQPDEDAAAGEPQLSTREFTLVHEAWENGASFILDRMVDDEHITSEQRLDYLGKYGI